MATTKSFVPSDTLVQARRTRCAEAWGSKNEVIAIHAGRSIPIPGGFDQRFEFRVHPDFQWLTGLSMEGGIVAFDPETGWEEFLPRTSRDAKIWEGAHDVTRGTPVEQFEGWIKKRSHCSVAHIGACGVDPQPSELSGRISATLLHLRREKDSFEIEAVERSIAATAKGFERLTEILRPGISERELQIELEAEMFRHGVERTAYGTIVGFGDHSAVLHFPPSDRRASDGDVALIDMGGDIGGYVADITRTVPVGGKWKGQAKDLYEMLLDVQVRTVQQCTVGVEWHEVHRFAARQIAVGLRSMGVLRCGEDEATETGAVALFFPHGIGHMVGLGVRDAGGVAPGRAEGRLCCGVRVRADLPLLENYLMTVEPGVYFIPALLDDSEARATHKDRVDFSKAEEFRKIGGMRIEDNILVTSVGPRVLTALVVK